MANPMLLPLLGWARKLRYPTLFKITALVFAVGSLAVLEIGQQQGAQAEQDLVDERNHVGHEHVDREPIEGEASRPGTRR